MTYWFAFWSLSCVAFGASLYRLAVDGFDWPAIRSRRMSRRYERLIRRRTLAARRTLEKSLPRSRVVNDRAWQRCQEAWK